jgi:predicted MFS family arabinose efflux permease
LFIFFDDRDLIDVDHHLSRRHFWINIKQLANFPWVPIYTITLTFFISFSHNNVRRFLDLYIVEKGYNELELGLLVFIVGIIGLLANLLVAPYFLKRYHNFRFLQAQFLFAPVLLFMAFYIENTLLGMYTFYIGYSIILAIYEPTAISFMSSNKDVSQGVLVGARQSVVGLGMTIGFIAGGFLYEKNNLYVFYLAVLFYIIVFVGFTILVMLKNKEVKEYRKNYLEEVRS